MQIPVVTKQMWNALTAALATWQAARQGELNDTRNTVAAQGNQAVTAAQAADGARQQILSLATLAGVQQVGSTAEMTQEGTAYILTTDLTLWRVVGGQPVQQLTLPTLPMIEREQRRRRGGVAAQVGLRRTLSLLAAGKPVRIHTYGTSSIRGVGYGAIDEDHTITGHLRTMLAAQWPGAQITVTTSSFPGAPTQELIKTLRTDVPDADLYIVQSGTVEAANWPVSQIDEYKYMLATLLGILKNRGRDVLWLNSQAFPTQPAGYETYVQAGAEVAAVLGIPVADRYGLMRDAVASGKYTLAQLLHTDSFHMSAVAYELVGRMIADMLSAPPAATIGAALISTNHPSVWSSVLPQWGASAAGKPLAEVTAYPLNDTADATRSLEIIVPFYGTSLSLNLPLSSAHNGLTGTVSVDGGAATVVPTNALAPIDGVTQHGSSLVLASGLTNGWHYVRLTLSFPLNASGGVRVVYINSLEIGARTAISAAWTLRVAQGKTVSAGSGLAVNVAAGQVVLNGQAVPSVAGSVTLPAADASLPRVDRVCLRYDGTHVVIAGVPASSPTAPATPGGHWSLATVAVAAGATTVGAITDARQLV